MTKKFCDNCKQEATEGLFSQSVDTVLRPSLMRIKFEVHHWTVSADGKKGHCPDLCANCYLTALHGAFKQPETTS